jgi:hypothetical protein
MADLYVLVDGGVERIAVPARGTLRLDELGKPATDDRGSVIALVGFERSGDGRPAVALVPRAGMRVRVGARTVRFARELRDREHVFFAEREAIFAADGAPILLEGRGALRACPVCCAADTPALRACPRCGLPACEACWRRFPRARCPGAGCDFTASLGTRPPGRAEFLTAALDDATGGA